MRRVNIPESVRPWEVGYERPSTIIMHSARRHEPDGSGWDDPSGIKLWVQITDPCGAIKDLTNAEAISLAAKQIPGGMASLSSNLEHIGEDQHQHNQQAFKNRAHEDLYSALVVDGVTIQDLAAVLAQMYAETQRLAETGWAEEDLLVIHQ